MDHYQQILTDLYEISMDDRKEISPPYTTNMDIEQKFDAILRTLNKSKRMQNQPLQLINAFYLGKLIESEIPFNDRHKYVKKLSVHYRCVSSRLYFLFESLGTPAISKLKRTTLTSIRRITPSEFQDLLNEISLIFSGAENLAEE